MGSFLRANITDDTFLRGSARVLYAPYAQAFPTQISDVLVLTAGGTQYDPQSGWVELGSTKSGISIARNNTEETYDVDQIYGEIDSAPTSWEMTISTAMAEMTPANLTVAWELGATTTDTAPTPDETHTGMGLPSNYVRRRLVIAHQRNNNKIRLYCFRKVQKSPQESTLQFQKTGDQQNAPVQFRALADTLVSDVNARFGEIIDQV